uniref:Uncharacterized protein n=1 Tax=Arundo donax TaxID=35708 RepID=A0A0A8XN85_ARUDO
MSMRTRMCGAGKIVSMPRP